LTPEFNRKYKEGTAAVCDAGPESVKQMQRLKKDFNKRRDLVAARVLFRKGMHEIKHSTSDILRIINNLI
jgi:predicted RNA binding protein with dsRBD fold (UPF0201 family)